MIDVVSLLAQGEEVMRELRDVLGRVLGCACVLKLGFSADEDLERLSRTPGLEALAPAQPLLDLQPCARTALGLPRRAPPGRPSPARQP